MKIEGWKDRFTGENAVSRPRSFVVVKYRALNINSMKK